MATTKKAVNKKRITKKAQPKGAAREKPGSTGKGNYYHIEVRSKRGLETFRTQDVGDPGHVQRVAGKGADGSWATVKWLIEKKDAHVSNGKLVGNTKDAKKLLADLGARPTLIKGDRFKAKASGDELERDKPSANQRRSQSANVKKGKAARQTNRTLKKEVGRLV